MTPINEPKVNAIRVRKTRLLDMPLPNIRMNPQKKAGNIIKKRKAITQADEVEELRTFHAVTDIVVTIVDVPLNGPNEITTSPQELALALVIGTVVSTPWLVLYAEPPSLVDDAPLNAVAV